MMRLAHDRLSALSETQTADTLDIIKLILEWRGRVSIVTEADKFFASDTLLLDADNAAGLLDLYEIIGPAAGYVAPGAEEYVPPVPPPTAKRHWVPTLTERQDEVDFILLSVLGPNFRAPPKGTKKRADGTYGLPEDWSHLPLVIGGGGGSGGLEDCEGEDGGDEPLSPLSAASTPTASARAPLSPSTRGAKKKKKKKFAAPSPIEISWLVETENGHVTRLSVSHEGLTGSLPQSLRRLIHLECLELPCLRPWLDPEAAHELIPKHLRPKPALDLVGSATLGYLPALRRLNLSGNLLLGPIPPNLGFLTNLAFLDLSRNRFTGSLHDGLGSLKELTWLDVSSCRLDGDLSPGFLQGVTKLELLHAQANMLCGPLSAGLANLVNLRDLDLSENKFSGLLPVELPTRLRCCERLNLSKNGLRGQLPTTLMDLRSCRELNLSANFFGGRLPFSVGCLAKNLEFVDLSNNNWGEAEMDELREYLLARLHGATPNIYV